MVQRGESAVNGNSFGAKGEKYGIQYTWAVLVVHRRRLWYTGQILVVQRGNCSTQKMTKKEFAVCVGNSCGAKGENCCIQSSCGAQGENLSIKGQGGAKEIAVCVGNSCGAQRELRYAKRILVAQRWKTAVRIVRYTGRILVVQKGNIAVRRENSCRAKGEVAVYKAKPCGAKGESLPYTEEILVVQSWKLWNTREMLVVSRGKHAYHTGRFLVVHQGEGCGTQMDFCGAKGKIAVCRWNYCGIKLLWCKGGNCSTHVKSLWRKRGKLRCAAEILAAQRGQSAVYRGKCCVQAKWLWCKGPKGKCLWRTTAVHTGDCCGATMQNLLNKGNAGQPRLHSGLERLEAAARWQRWNWTPPLIRRLRDSDWLALLRFEAG